jgi:starvation-inducible DNA-binding protein
MTQIKRTAMKQDDIELTVHHLGETLIELVDLTLQTKQAHWNVTGPSFRALHLQLDDVVRHTRDYSDSVAERIVIMGCPAHALAGQVAHQSKVDPMPDGFVPDEEVVKLMVERLSEFCGRLRGRISATEGRDPVSADLLTQILGKLEEQVWMFHAQAQ